jgi:hypothetical protein
MTAITATDALVKQVATRGVDILKVEWRGGDAAAATGLFLQVHNSAVTPTTGASPVAGCSWPLATSTEGYKDFKGGELRCPQGCFVGVSTTEATWTAAVTNDKFANLRVELDKPQYPAASAISTAGDLTSAVTGLAVWSEATGAANPKQLLTLEVDGTNLAAGAYIMLFATDSPQNGDTPVLQKSIAQAATLTKAAGKALEFGPDGRSVASRDTDLHQGCSVAISSTAETLTTIVSGSCRIKAWYK